MREALRGRGAQALIVGAAALLVFVGLRTRQYTDVDGALRCLEVFRHPGVFFGGNNHLLYPLDVLAWTRLAGFLGANVRDAESFIRVTQGLNALAAAATIALVYWLVAGATASRGAALAAAAAVAFSRAFLLHATNAAEPMVGLFLSLLALASAELGVRRGRAWPIAAAGIALALSMATYESMVLVAPAAVALCLVSDGEARPRPKTHPGPRRVGVMVVSAAISGLAIYGLAYAASGTGGPGEMVRRFVTVPGAGIWGGLRLSKLANAPLGGVNAVVPALPRGYAGLRTLLRSPEQRVALAWISLLIVGAGAAVVAMLVRARRAWSAFPADRRRMGASLAVGLIFALVVPLYWDPVYDKLWLQPLALAACLGAVALAPVGVAPPRSGRRTAVTALVVGLAAVNLGWAVPASRKRSPYLEPARQVAATVRAGDLVVHDWDPVSVLYTSMWPESARQVDFISAAIELGQTELTGLRDAVAAAQRRGGTVYFLGVLDEPRAAWNAFVGHFSHIPYEALDGYRDSARIVASFPAPVGQVTLRRY